MPGGHDAPEPWSPAELDGLRQQVAVHVETLLVAVTYGWVLDGPVFVA
jgi:hypothetical protein